ncbi:hypothetical protein [uncultured Ruminococcus sp.]|jgi:tetratricopeptide (TPR) repeat protein|uniref:hypothetical protein n=1 Tax=uncultured Ruminococcus sp. TaxID=165186 RepID=UPI00265E24D6|nr:hypothetical protein [uncultured Ruminococcus sp.]
MKEFPLFHDKIQFHENLLKYDYLRSNFCELILDWEKSFKQFYSKVTTLEQLNQALEMFLKEYQSLIDFSVFVFMENQIDEIDSEKFTQLVQDTVPNFNPFYAVEKTMNAIEEAAEEVAAKIQDQRAAERSNRSYWQGGGFGLKGAIKGALTAGALNMATSAIRGIGDSITDALDKSRFNAFIEETLQNPEYGVQNAFLTAIRLDGFDCLITVYMHLIDFGKIPKVCMDVDAYVPKINNYMNYGDFDTAYRLLKEAIVISPYELQLYQHLHTLADKKAANEFERERFHEDVEELQGYFRPDIFEF